MLEFESIIRAHVGVVKGTESLPAGWDNNSLSVLALNFILMTFKDTCCL